MRPCFLCWNYQGKVMSLYTAFVSSEGQLSHQLWFWSKLDQLPDAVEHMLPVNREAFLSKLGDAFWHEDAPVFDRIYYMPTSKHMEKGDLVKLKARWLDACLKAPSVLYTTIHLIQIISDLWKTWKNHRVGAWRHMLLSLRMLTARSHWELFLMVCFFF